MNDITSFACFKNNNKEKDSHPDYRLSIKQGEKYVEIGSGWLKESKNGGKFISFQLKKQYGSFPGFKIVEDAVPTIDYPDGKDTGAHKRNEDAEKVFEEIGF